MSESLEHCSLRAAWGTILGRTECKVGRGRADACNSKVTAEIECSGKKGNRSCRVDFRYQPDVKREVARDKPFASMVFTGDEALTLDKIFSEAGLRSGRSPT